MGKAVHVAKSSWGSWGHQSLELSPSFISLSFTFFCVLHSQRARLPFVLNGTLTLHYLAAMSDFPVDSGFADGLSTSYAGPSAKST